MGETTPPTGLIKKLAKVLQAVDHVEKLGQNAGQGYRYQRATDLAQAVRKAMAEQNVMLIPKSWERSTEAVTTVNRDGTERQGRIEHLMGHFQFIDGDTGEVLDLAVPSSGYDTGDKGIFKAITGALKYVLKSVFLIPEEADDPENDHGTVDAAQAVAQRKIAESKFGQRSAASVQNKTVEYWEHILPGNIRVWVFLPGHAFAAMLDNGLSAITVMADNLKARIMTTDKENIEMASGIALKLGFTLQKVVPPAYPEKPVKSLGEKPIIYSATEKPTATGKERLIVRYGTHTTTAEYSVWDKGLWGYIVAGVKQPAEFEIAVKGKYRDIKSIKRIGDISFSVIDGKCTPDIQRGVNAPAHDEPPAITDDDLPANMFEPDGPI